MKNLTFISMWLFIFSVQIIMGQIPQTINYQGILTDTGGDVVTDGILSKEIKLSGEKVKLGVKK